MDTKKRAHGRPKAPARAKKKGTKTGKDRSDFGRTRPGPRGGLLRIGNPGNAGGGQLSNEFKERCRNALDRIDAVNIAVSIARNTRKAARDRLAALAWLADRGYGKPTQPVSGEGGGPIEGKFVVEFVDVGSEPKRRG